MKINKIKLAKLNIPLIRPFVTALRSTEYVEDIVVILETDTGLCGYGSAASTPVITGDSQESIIGAVQILTAKLINKEIANFEELLLTVQTTVVNNSSAKAALDIALHDLVAKSLQVPLYKFLGGGNPELITLTTVSAQETEQMIADAKLFVDQGFKTLKIKVGLDPEQDIKCLKLIRKAIGNDTEIICDANQGWEAKSALRVINNLVKDDINIAMIEQPVKAWDYQNLKYVREKSKLPIYADEAVFNLHDAAALISGSFIDGINIKLMKCGGIYRARGIYDLATSYSLPCLAGCMLESPIGITAMASFIAGRSNVRFIDLDPIAMIKTNPVHGGISLDGTKLRLTDKPGLGIEHIDGLEFVNSL